MKIQKKKWGGGSGGCGRGRVRGVRVDVNEELKFLRNFEKKIFFFFWGGGGGGRGRVGGGGGQGGCERRIEVLVKIKKKNLGGGSGQGGGDGGRVGGSG